MWPSLSITKPEPRACAPRDSKATRAVARRSERRRDLDDSGRGALVDLVDGEPAAGRDRRRATAPSARRRSSTRHRGLRPPRQHRAPRCRRGERRRRARRSESADGWMARKASPIRCSRPVGEAPVASVKRPLCSWCAGRSEQPDEQDDDEDQGDVFRPRCTRRPPGSMTSGYFPPWAPVKQLRMSQSVAAITRTAERRSRRRRPRARCARDRRRARRPASARARRTLAAPR